MAGTHGTARIDELRSLSGLGPTRFFERFRQRVGLTSKRHARVLRFDRALARLVASPGPALAEDALATGHAAERFRPVLRRAGCTTA